MSTGGCPTLQKCLRVPHQRGHPLTRPHDIRPQAPRLRRGCAFLTVSRCWKPRSWGRKLAPSVFFDPSVLFQPLLMLYLSKCTEADIQHRLWSAYHVIRTMDCIEMPNYIFLQQIKRCFERTTLPVSHFSLLQNSGMHLERDFPCAWPYSVLNILSRSSVTCPFQRPFSICFLIVLAVA